MANKRKSVGAHLIWTIVAICIVALFVLVFWLIPLHSNAAGISGDAAIGGDGIIIHTSSRTAGAIDSLTWNDKQFINADDHGRELQSASSYDGQGEGENPTEAGSLQDGAGNTSTSVLRSIQKAAGNVLLTNTRMAYWKPFNGLVLSNDILSKKVTIGFAGIPNVIEHQITFHVPVAHSSATFEVLTGYMQPEFNTFWSYDPKTGKLAALSNTYSEEPLPEIFSTADGKYAMGIYCPWLPQPGHNPKLGYFRGSFGSTTKWNCVYRAWSAVKAGPYTYTAYSIVGTLNQVKRSMQKLYNHFNPHNLPTGYFDTITQAGVLLGWTTDPDDYTASIQFKVYVDGPADTGTLVGSGTANVYRPDVNKVLGITGNHGFSWAIPGVGTQSTPQQSSSTDAKAGTLNNWPISAAYTPQSTHQYYIYGVDANTGALNQLHNSPKIF